MYRRERRAPTSGDVMKRKRDKPKTSVPAQCGRAYDGYVWVRGMSGKQWREKADRYFACKKRPRPKSQRGPA